MTIEQKILDAMQAGNFSIALALQMAVVLRFAAMPGNSPEQSNMATCSAAAIEALLEKHAATLEGATFQECCQLVMAGRQMGIAETLVASNAALSMSAASKPH